MQLDKELIKKNFKKSFLTYEDNAFAQKESAKVLIDQIKSRYFKNILEIGSYSGYLTNLAIDNLNCAKYVALDIVEESEFAVKKINPKIEFYNCDIENFQSESKFDLILSNASLQWCNSFENTVKKIKSLLSVEGMCALSIFQKGNLKEIKEIFGIGLNYPTLSEIKKMFSYGAKIIELDKTIKFPNGLEAIKHLKKTGVNSLKKNGLPISEFKAGLEILEKKYNNQITYKSVIIID